MQEIVNEISLIDFYQIESELHQNFMFADAPVFGIEAKIVNIFGADL